MRSSILTSILRLGLEKAAPAIMVLVLAVVIGLQIQSPNKRFIEAIVGIIFVTLIARYPLVWSLSFFIVTYPFPFALRVGHSNVVFLPLIVIVWLIRVAMKNVERPIGAIFDWAVFLMTFSYVISFYNNPGGKQLIFGLVYFLIYLTGVGFAYLIVNFARDAGTLERIVFAEIIGCAFVVLFCIIELLFPGRTLVPGWLYTWHEKVLVMKDIRIQGPFRDFELLAEYLALNIPIILLFFVRSKRMLFKWAYFSLIIACVAIMMATSTRGAFISLGIGMFYTLWVIRRDLDIVKLAYIAFTVLGLLVVTELVISRYTISGGLMYRLMKTRFEGYVPDTRAHAWPAAIERAKEHLIIGHSPAWDFSKKLTKFNWPHNGYLFYLNMTGIIGLITFLILLYKLLMATIRARARSMFDPSFSRALMLVLHIDLVIFMIDEIKIDYLRNNIYIYFIWFLFGAIAATYNVVQTESREAARLKRDEQPPSIPLTGRAAT
jgi:O-antigen ligase